MPPPNHPPRVLILDGGLGTTLEQNHGIQFTSSEPLWSSHLVLSSPSTLLSCQRSFARIPVDILLTATYQISLEGLARTKTPEHPDGIRESGDILRVLESAVDIAHQAAHDQEPGSPSKNIKLALSIGPYGACMVPSAEYTGIYDKQHNDLASLTQWHTERMRLLSQLHDLDSRIGFLAIETLPRRDEIVAVRHALRSVPQLAALPFWISCLYPAGLALPDGTSPEDVVRATFDSSDGPMPWGVGINCTKVDKLDALVRSFEGEMARMREEGLLVGAQPALVLYPDGTNGEVYNTETKTWEAPLPASGSHHQAERDPWEMQLAKVVRGAAGRGMWSVIVAGGCCMAKPADIARLRTVLYPGESSSPAPTAIDHLSTA